MMQLIISHADASINHTKREFDIVPDNLFLLNLKRNTPTFSELCRIIDEVCENL